MDSKITKKRLSDFFAYEWIMLIIVMVASIIVMELIYTVAGVRLTTGQQFKIYFDETISSKSNSYADSLKYQQKDSAFSFDILSFGCENLLSENNVMNVRLSVQEGDIIFTDNFVADEEKPWDNRANELIDRVDCNIYSYKNLQADMKSYLESFILSGKEINKANINTEAVKESFLFRMKKDNRFRTDSEKEAGIALEKERIEKLCDEYIFFSNALAYGAEHGWFYTYRKYEKFINNNKDIEGFDEYKKLYDEQTEEIYGLNVGALEGGKMTAEQYFVVNKTKDAKNIVLLVFNFKDYQESLQYETVSVINHTIRNLVSAEVYSTFGA